MDNPVYQGLLIGLGILVVSWFYGKQLPKMDLVNKFKKLGDMTGKHKDEIIKKAGKPKAINYLESGNQQLQWKAGGYHISLLFDKNGNFIRVVDEITL